MADTPPRPAPRNRKPGAPGTLLDPRQERPGEQIGGGFFVFRRGRKVGRVQAPEWPFEHPTLEAAQAQRAVLMARFPGEVFEVFARVAADEAITALRAERDALRAQLATARAALAPFAAAPLHGIHGGPMVQAILVYEDGSNENSARHKGRISPSAFTAARAALLDTPAPDPVAPLRRSPLEHERDAGLPSRCRPENYADGVQCASCGKGWGEDGPDECPLKPLAGEGKA